MAAGSDHDGRLQSSANPGSFASTGVNGCVQTKAKRVEQLVLRCSAAHSIYNIAPPPHATGFVGEWPFGKGEKSSQPCGACMQLSALFLQFRIRKRFSLPPSPDCWELFVTPLVSPESRKGLRRDHSFDARARMKDVRCGKFCQEESHILSRDGENKLQMMPIWSQCVATELGKCNK